MFRGLYLLPLLVLQIVAQSNEEQSNRTKELQSEQPVNDELSKPLVYTVCGILVLGLCYFIYNFYVCHKKKVNLGGEEDDYGMAPGDIEIVSKD